MPFGVSFYAAAYQPPPLAQRPLKINLGDTAMLLGYDLRVNGQLLPHLQPVSPGRCSSSRRTGSRSTATPSASSGPSRTRDSRTSTSRTGASSSRRVATRSHRMASPFAATRTSRSPGLPPGVYQIDLGLFVGGRPVGVRNMELVELLPTRGRCGRPVQVNPGGTLRRSSPERRHDVRPARQARVVRPSDRAERPPLCAVAGPGRDSGRRGDEPPVATLPAGETLQVDLLWRSLQDHPGVFIVNVTLDDDQGFRWATREVEPVDRMYPSWMWSADEVIRDQVRLEIPPEVRRAGISSTSSCSIGAARSRRWTRGAAPDPGEADRRRHPAVREPAPRARR